MKILIFSLKQVPFAPRISEIFVNTDIDVYESHYDDLTFDLPNKGAELVNIFVNQVDIKEYSLVYFRRVEAFDFLVGPIIAYLEKYKIPFLDECNQFITRGAKLKQMLELQLNNLPTPKTICYSPEVLASKYDELSKSLGSPFIIKEYNASHGKLNFLINSEADFTKAINENPTLLFLCQEFLPNQFDYRLVTIGYKVEVIKKKIRTKLDSHINNVYNGAAVEYIEPGKMSELVTLAEKSAELLKINIAGVDVLVSEKNQLPYILEVNKSPDISDTASLNAIANYLKTKAHQGLAS